MSRIPPKLREQMSNDEYYYSCARREALNDHVCQGRITWEHCFIYASKQIQEKWAIIPLCEYAHSALKFMDSGILDKDINQWIALNRATDAELLKYDRANLIQKRTYLNSLFT